LNDFRKAHGPNCCSCLSRQRSELNTASKASQKIERVVAEVSFRIAGQIKSVCKGIAGLGSAHIQQITQRYESITSLSDVDCARTMLFLPSKRAICSASTTFRRKALNSAILSLSGSVRMRAPDDFWLKITRDVLRIFSTLLGNQAQRSRSIVTTLAELSMRQNAANCSADRHNRKINLRLWIMLGPERGARL
jgi:hypothetical protein